MKNYLAIDRIVQGLIFIPYAILGLLTVFGNLFGLHQFGDYAVFFLILHFVIGCYQLFSGVIGGLIHNDPLRRKYLLMNIIFFGIGFLGYTLGQLVNFPFLDVIGIAYWFLIPSGIATWYFTQTWIDYKELQQEYV